VSKTNVTSLATRHPTASVRNQQQILSYEAFAKIFRRTQPVKA
jgi:hypothetical protein